MTLKSRIAVNISLLFSIVFGMATIFIFIQFADFRRQEFKSRLEEKANIAALLVAKADANNDEIIRLLDQNSISKLYNEKILIYDNNQNLIYKSRDSTEICCAKDDLIILKTQQSFHKNRNSYDIYGCRFDLGNSSYYFLVQAEDKYGNNKLRYLGLLLAIALITGNIIVWVLSFYLVSKLTEPLDSMIMSITKISENSLTMRLDESHNKDEISKIARAFNQMMMRIEKSYNKQKEFSAQASHELRTPIARIISQLENLQLIEKHSIETANYLENIRSDAFQMADLLNSLLLLSKNEELINSKTLKRIDEVLFDVVERAKKEHTDIHISFNVLVDEAEEIELEVLCNESLLKIAFSNLLNNGYFYSDEKKVIIEVEQIATKLFIRFINNGEAIGEEEQASLFEPYMRGKNSSGKKGTGLGLSIATRIFLNHNAILQYRSDLQRINVFEVIFDLK